MLKCWTEIPGFAAKMHELEFAIPVSWVPGAGAVTEGTWHLSAVILNVNIDTCLLRYEPRANPGGEYHRPFPFSLFVNPTTPDGLVPFPMHEGDANCATATGVMNVALGSMIAMALTKCHL